VLSLQKYRARPGLAAVLALVLAAAAAVLLVLLPERWERILVAALTFLAGAAFAVVLARRARSREQARIEELETAEARHSALLDGLPLVTWLTAPGDRSETLYVSPSIAEVTGYSPSEWIEQPELHVNLLHPDDRERVVSEFERTSTGAPVHSLEYRLLARDGRAVWVREDTATVRDSKGEPLYVQTFLRDVGELKRGDDRRELLQSAEREAASESAERRSRLDLLRHVGNEISAGIDLDPALAEVAELIVVDFADWCLIDVADDANDLRRVAVARGATTSPSGGRIPADDPEPEVKAVLEQGRTSDISCACHWTVDVAAAKGHGKLYSEVYSVSPAGIFVPADSPIKSPEQLAGIPISVGYQSGSHYSTIQALEQYMAADKINLSFVEGMLFNRMELLLDGKVPAWWTLGLSWVFDR